MERTWICPDCSRVARRKPRSDDTPIGESTLLDDTVNSVDEKLDNDRTLPGDTLQPSTSSGSSPPCLNFSVIQPNSNITLEQISQLLDAKLVKNTNYILSKIDAINTTIQAKLIETTSCLKEELLAHIKNITIQQQKVRSDLDVLKKRIENLETDKQTLCKQIAELQGRSVQLQPNIRDLERSKKFIIYGLEETHRESEYDLCNKLVEIFGYSLNVNLNGFIENVARLGKRGYKRPVMVELISKRMTRYLLQNSRHLRNTGLTIAEYLDENSLLERTNLRLILIEERKKGRRAVIRNNKLYIDDKEYNNQHSERDQINSTQNPSQNPDTVSDYRSSSTNNCYASAAGASSSRLQPAPHPDRARFRN